LRAKWVCIQAGSDDSGIFNRRYATALRVCACPWVLPTATIMQSLRDGQGSFAAASPQGRQAIGCIVPALATAITAIIQFTGGGPMREGCNRSMIAAVWFGAY
jgi:hypothetical protein